jgi:hypothetical protein
MKSALGHHLDASSEQSLEIHDQPAGEPGACSWASFHQEIEVACRSRLATGDGAKDSNVSNAVAGSDFQDFFAIQPDKLRGVKNLAHRFYGTAYH